MGCKTCHLGRGRVLRLINKIVRHDVAVEATYQGHIRPRGTERKNIGVRTLKSV